MTLRATPEDEKKDKNSLTDRVVAKDDWVAKREGRQS